MVFMMMLDDVVSIELSVFVDDGRRSRTYSQMSLGLSGWCLGLFSF